MKKTKIWVLLAVIAALLAVVLLLKNKPEEHRQENLPAQPASEAQSGPGELEDGAQAEFLPLDLDSIPGFINGAADGRTAVCGLELPYRGPDTDLTIEGVGQYSGPFVEDGSDEPTANALALVVKNDDAALAEYAELTFAVGEGEQAVFQLSGVPGGEYVLVMEKNGRPFSDAEVLAYADSLYAARKDASMMADKIEVYSADGALTAKNVSGQDLSTVYIRYKSQLIPRCYLGGITYSCKLEGIPAGQEKTAQTGHFSSNSSRIVMVETVD